jgi:L-seryl-tRNA(Ser) seleniumtransferase
MDSSHPPSVDVVARRLAVHSGLPHPLLVDAARSAIRDSDAVDQDEESIVNRAAVLASDMERSLLQPVINATGVLLHTNLGRAPLRSALEPRYSNLEFDLGQGRRGSRSLHAAQLIARLCGAEDAMVVNNGASALLLVLAALAAGRQVVVSRGELIEIGGGFRIPEVLASSGARLVEVGTTNRTAPEDYAAGAGPETALLLKVHTSNYQIVGFTRSVTVPELVEVARRRSPLGGDPVPVIMDIGSGLLDERCPWVSGGPPAWISGEPGARQVLAQGADLVTFSGDKLLGGPQAGLIVGRRAFVEACRRHPLARALRTGQLVLASLQEVALSYLRPDAGREIPFWRMATTPDEELRVRAEAIGVGRVTRCESVLGAGSSPGRSIPSFGVALDGDRTADLLVGKPPVLARVTHGETVCDLRTVRPEEDQALTERLMKCG